MKVKARPNWKRLFIVAGLVLAPRIVSGQSWNFELVHAFTQSGHPEGSLIQAADGDFYGTTSIGGTFGVGTVYRMDAQGHLTTLHSFGYADGAFPAAAVVQGTDGAFYGTTSWGGRANRGTVYRVDADGAFVLLHSFGTSEGANPRAPLAQGSDGTFYGTTKAGGADDSGTVFKIDSAGDLTTLRSFNFNSDGAYPLAALVQASDGFFYGTTSDGGAGGGVGQGTAFKIDPAGNFTKLATFEEMAHPHSSLLESGDGYFYGTTFSGGVPYSTGALFKMDHLGNLTKLHDFYPWADGSGPESLTGPINGYFYGTTVGVNGATTCGTVYQVDTSGNVETLRVFGSSGGDGCHPTPLTMATDGQLVGATTTGGLSACRNGDGCGTVFEVDTSGALTTLATFSQPEGAYPTSLIQTQGGFFGTADEGGAFNGTLFRLNASGALSTIHAFDGADGKNPNGVVLALDGSLYGTCSEGGAGNHGTAYRSTPLGNVTLLHSFSGTDGDHLLSPLIQGSDGNLYGTTYDGGANGVGSVFRMDTSGALESLYSFSGSDGANPSGALVQAADGNLYGTTYGGGADALGTLFKIDPLGNLVTLHSFAGSEGANPAAALIVDVDGGFYGTGSSGGAQGFGSVFKASIAGEVTSLHSFTGLDGAGPGGLIRGADGTFYGTTTTTVFSMESSGAVTVLPYLDGSIPSFPSSLVQVGDGSIYGVTLSAIVLQEPNMGGEPDSGLVFRLSHSSLSVNAIIPTSGPPAGNTAVNVLGGGFASEASLTIGGVAAADVSLLDSTFLYAFSPELAPGTLNSVTVTIAGSLPNISATLASSYMADFLDVLQGDTFHAFVESIFRAGVTAGCGSGNYCRDGAALRNQMAVFVLKAKEGATYLPPPAAGIFTDVPASDPFAPWIEELYRRGVVAGCGAGPTYCPTAPVLRQQMAVFLLKTLLGSPYVPPPCVGTFADVPCSNPFGSWVEDLYNRRIAAGCGNDDYCPTTPTTRGQMAVFLTKTFSLQ